jgi:hypothetical protein
MDDIIRAAVKSAMEDDLFKSMNLGAIRARAGRLESGDTFWMGGYDFLVAEDEEGTGIAVMAILSRQYIDNFAIYKLEAAGISFEDKAPHEKTEILRKFLEELRKNLQKFQQILILFGPGDDLTLEKAVYAREIRRRI